MLTIEECAERLEMKITTHFHNGYIQNNSSYCYIDENEYVRVAQDPTITPKMLFDEESKPKKSRLMSVLTPGFSNIVAQNSNDLTEKYVRNKAVDKKGSNITMKLIAPGIELPKGISWKYTADYRQRELDISAARPLPMQHFPSDPTVVSQEQEAAASSTIKTAKAKSISEVLRSGKYGSMKTAGGAHEL